LLGRPIVKRKLVDAEMQLLRADVFYVVKKDIKRLIAQVHLHQRLLRLVLSDQVVEEYPIPVVVLEVL